MANESVATQVQAPKGAGFAFIPRTNQHLFHVAQDASQDALLAHLSCMLVAMREITRNCDGDLAADLVWLLNSLLGQADAIADSLELSIDTPSGNRLGKILADASALPDADIGVLVSCLRGMQSGLEFDPESLRSASDASVRALVARRAAA